MCFTRPGPTFPEKKKTFLNYNHDDLNTMNLFEEPIFNSSTLKNDEDIAKTIFEIFFFFFKVKFLEKGKKSRLFYTF